MSQWVWGFLSAAAVAVITWFLTRLQRSAEKKDEQRQAAAALRFELESNLGWLDDILDSHNYLRDEAWVAMKNKGYISYLRRPIPKGVIRTYDQLHKLNEHIRLLKEPSGSNGTFDGKKAMADRDELKKRISELIDLMDKKYSRIGKNFRSE